MNKKEILTKLESRKDKLKARGVKKIGLFGSYLKGTQKRGSDVDILVSFNKPSWRNYIDTYKYIENLLGRNVDLVVEKSLKPELNYVKKEAAYVSL